MATPPISATEAKRRCGMIEQCLTEGFVPFGHSGGKGSALEEACRRLDLNSGTLAKAIKRRQLTPDWSLYRAAERKEVPHVELPQQAEKPRVRVQVGKPGGTSLDVLAIGDIHDAPDIPKDRFYWYGKLAADIGCNYIIPIGDMGTFDSLSRHISPGTLAAKSQNPWETDAGSLHEALGELDRGLGSHAPKKHLVQGNHERRIPLYEEAHPEVQGMLTGEFQCLLEDHGFTSTPYGEYFFLGGVGFIHCAINRLGKSYGGKNAEATIANDALFDHVLGHSHVKREHRAAKLGPSKHVTILNLGSGLPWGHVEEYVYHGALTGWWWGAHHLRIQNGQITDVNAISNLELERRYG